MKSKSKPKHYDICIGCGSNEGQRRDCSYAIWCNTCWWDQRFYVSLVPQASSPEWKELFKTRWDQIIHEKTFH